jgi:hypothetical protein
MIDELLLSKTYTHKLTTTEADDLWFGVGFNKVERLKQ